MAGTKAGGLAAARTNKDKYGQDFYANIGAMGGRIGSTGGFAADVPCNCKLFAHEHLVRQCAGKKGGQISRRPKRSTQHGR